MLAQYRFLVTECKIGAASFGCNILACTTHGVACDSTMLTATVLFTEGVEKVGMGVVTTC